ncbi:MAG: hypothetical protein HOW73_23945 [Polyangiaceae bacterium]|nr:hypothetical protein [Polyangiaceae bacterium]
MKKLAAALLVALIGCDSSLDPGAGGSSSASTGGLGGASSASESSSASSSSGTGGAPEDKPCPGWDGWAAWDDWAASYPFCYATDPQAVVEPIEWEPCDPLSGMSTGCRQMKVTWPYNFSPFAVVASGFEEEDGTVLLSFTRVNSSNEGERFIMPIVAEADGPVRAALLDPRSNVSEYAWMGSTMSRGVGAGRALFELTDFDIEGELPDALVGFELGVPRPFVEHGFSDGIGHGFGTSSDIWGTWDSNRILIARWGEEPIEVWGPAQSGYQQTRFVPFGEFGTWHDGDEFHANVMAWTPERGAYPFIHFGNDETHGAEALGTDGTDLVWIQSEGRLPDGTYAERSIVTSPFTTDPDALEPRRLRSYPSSYAGILPFTVGCGYASYSYEPGKVLLIRIEDGAWWELPSSGCTGPDFTGDYCFESPYAITCDELFLKGGFVMNIARVEISSLGEPNPPD